MQAWRFRHQSFAQNQPVNENSPSKRNDVYRLSHARMQKLRDQSTTWYTACNMETNPTRDVARAKFSSLDPLTLNQGGTCRQMEYWNIRGNSCSNCNAPWWQGNNGYALHIDSGGNHCGSSGMHNIGHGAAGSEDNFGYYYGVNSNFKCTAHGSSTTQWWFGK